MNDQIDHVKSFASGRLSPWAHIATVGRTTPRRRTRTPVLARRDALDDGRHEVGQGSQRRRQRRMSRCTGRSPRTATGSKCGGPASCSPTSNETSPVERRVRLRPERVRPGRPRRLADHRIPGDHADPRADPEAVRHGRLAALERRERRGSGRPLDALGRCRQAWRSSPARRAAWAVRPRTCSPTRGPGRASPTSAPSGSTAVVAEITVGPRRRRGDRRGAPTWPTRGPERLVDRPSVRGSAASTSSSTTPASRWSTPRSRPTTSTSRTGRRRSTSTSRPTPGWSGWPPHLIARDRPDRQHRLDRGDRHDGRDWRPTPRPRPAWSV